MAHVILVHGMLATQESWFDIPAKLRTAGHTVKNFTLPGHKPSFKTLTTTLADYVEAVKKRFPMNGQCCLIGHSMGGMAISQAAALNPEKVSKLIYVAAMMPQNGEAIDDLMLKSGSSIGQIKKALNDHGLKHGHPALGVQPVQPLNDPFEETSTFADIPRYYIRTTQDVVLTTKLQNKMIKAWKGTTVKDLQTNHFPQISKPEELSKALVECLA